MSALELVPQIADEGARRSAVERLRAAQVILPTLGQLATPSRIPGALNAELDAVDPDEPRAANLFRVHWYNDALRRRRAALPGYIELPEPLTGVKARIVVALGCRFPMIGAHKVLAAYGCLAPRLVTGRFDPTVHKAVWPSTGNRARPDRLTRRRIMGTVSASLSPARMAECPASGGAGWSVRRVIALAGSRAFASPRPRTWRPDEVPWRRSDSIECGSATVRSRPCGISI
jgi:cysteine synthase